MRNGTLQRQCRAAGHPGDAFRRVGFEHQPDFADIGFEREAAPLPLCPNRPEQLDQDCYEAFNIQVQGLVRRFQATSGKHLVIGVSGGLDSTHALIVAPRTCDWLGLPRSTILGFTMPGFATGEATKGNAWKLMNALGIVGEEIDIRPPPARCSPTSATPSPGRAGLRRHLRERAGGAAHRLSVPPRQPALRLRRRHRRPFRDRPGLVDLRRRRPDEPLRRQCRRARRP
jgi:NAD+ synthase (glutamine-hydrolysing)